MTTSASPVPPAAAPPTTPPTTPPDPASERVTFVQQQLPGLDAAVYRLSIAQQVLAAGEKTVLNTDPIARDYRFAVAGPRFRLPDPAGTISSLFPAANATGDFHTVLPHVVLTAPTLPWIRTPERPEGDADPTAESPTDQGVASWLAVLTLDADDAAAWPEQVDLDPVGVTLGDLFPVGAYPHSRLPAGVHSYFDDATNTDGLQPGEALDDLVQVIDLPLGLFAEIAPSPSDLVLNSHVRQLSLRAKPALLGAEPAADPLGTYSIVIGNRLPQNVQTSHAYLVCLEALAPFLPPAGPTTGRVRLAVLAHWTFVSQGSPLDFTTAVAELNHRPTPTAPDAPVTTLRIARDLATTDPAGAAIGAALDRGHAPLRHALRTGETTVSWYRGPLSPDDVPPDPDLPVPYTCSDAALVFDPTTGLLDASLAAAWTIGRLVALQDKGFSTALYTWKRGLVQTAVDAAERAILAEILGDDQVQDRSTRRPLLDATMRALSRRRS